MEYCVYILQGNRYFVGYTKDLKRRVEEHKMGKVKSTSKLGILSLIGYFICNNKEEAILLEIKIKKTKNTKRWIGSDGFIFI